jgi:hypothetical protein
MTMALRLLISAFLLGGLFTPEALGATVTAASCQSPAVQTAINSASSGDTVVIPAGRCAWNTGISITKWIRLTCAISSTTTGGGGACIIENKTGDAAGSAIHIVDSAAGHIEIDNLAIVSDLRPAAGLWMISVSPGTNGKAILIHHNTFQFLRTNQGGIGALNFGVNRGVVYSNVLTQPMPNGPGYINPAAGIVVQLNASNASASWASVSTMGMLDTTGQNNVYVENNLISNFNVALTDCSEGARMVFRYNTVQNSRLNGHGVDSGAYGCRHTEVYKNIFTHYWDRVDPIEPPLPSHVFQRGGEHVVTQNDFGTINAPHWGGNDLSPVSFQQWGIRSLPGPCYLGSYPYPHQIGQGYDGRATFVSGTYVWNNSGASNPNSRPFYQIVHEAATQCTGTPLSVYDFIKENRDVFLSAKPGYIPYTHPHPLTTGASTTAPLASPSNLQVR